MLTNLPKSSYMIINGKDNDPKVDLTTNSGILPYKSTVVYLGAIIGDTGNLMADVDKHTESKRSNITIKFNNFCRKNYLSPIDIKLMVLDTCASSALLYGCETWGKNIPASIDVLYRTGIKYALSIRPSINNELVYNESGCLPLSIRIRTQQLKFWNNIKGIIQENPNNPLNKLLVQCDALNLPYIKYYHDLETYQSPTKCYVTLRNDFETQNRLRIIRTAAEDSLSRLGAYM